MRRWCLNFAQVYSLFTVFFCMISQAKTLADIIQSIETNTKGKWSVISVVTDPKTQISTYTFAAERVYSQPGPNRYDPMAHKINVKIVERVGLEKLDNAIRKKGIPIPIAEEFVLPADQGNEKNMLVSIQRNDGLPYFFPNTELADANQLKKIFGVEFKMDDSARGERPKYMFDLGMYRASFETQHPGFIVALLKRFGAPMISRIPAMGAIETQMVFPKYEESLVKESATLLGFKYEFIPPTSESQAKFALIDPSSGFSFSIVAWKLPNDFYPDALQLFQLVKKIGTVSFRQKYIRPDLLKEMDRLRFLATFDSNWHPIPKESQKKGTPPVLTFYRNREPEFVFGDYYIENERNVEHIFITAPEETVKRYHLDIDSVRTNLFMCVGFYQ